MARLLSHAGRGAQSSSPGGSQPNTARRVGADAEVTGAQHACPAHGHTSVRPSGWPAAAPARRDRPLHVAARRGARRRAGAVRIARSPVAAIAPTGRRSTAVPQTVPAHRVHPALGLGQALPAAGLCAAVAAQGRRAADLARQGHGQGQGQDEDEEEAPRRCRRARQRGRRCKRRGRGRGRRRVARVAAVAAAAPHRADASRART